MSEDSFRTAPCESTLEKVQNNLAFYSFNRIFANDMGKNEMIQLFGEQKVRTEWDDEKQKWFFSIVDVCWVLTDQPDYDGAKNYWKVLKFRLKAEGNESVTNCNQLKMVSPKDGKRYKTDVAERLALNYLNNY